jgi:Fur family ferric uptake transcriptional regulator
MANLNINDLLKQKNLRLTDARKGVLEAFQNSRSALSHRDLDKKLPTYLDRITMYRTLMSFKKKGLIHSVTDPESGIARYLFTDPSLPKYHAHFRCTGCDLLICLSISISHQSMAALPDGFQGTSYSFIIEGLCDKCL